MEEFTLTKQAEETAKSAVIAMLPRFIERYGLPLENQQQIIQSKACSAISESIRTIGYVKRGWLVDVISQACPYFAQVAESFINEVFSVVQIAEETRCKQYDKITDWVLEHSQLSDEQKIHEYKSLMHQEHNENLETLKMAGTFALTAAGITALGLVLTNPDVNKTNRKNTKHIVDGVKKIIKAIK